jgi:hypothetical protein
MEKKSDVFSELKKEMAKNKPVSAPQESKTEPQAGKIEPEVSVKQADKKEEVSAKETEKKAREVSAKEEDSKERDVSAKEVFGSHSDEEEKLLKQKKNLRRLSMIALFISLVVILIVFGVIFFSGSSHKIDESTLAAKVDGKYITITDVLQWQSFLSIQPQSIQKREYNQTESLKQLIQYELLVKEAKKEYISVTDADINSLYDYYNLETQFNLEKILAAQNKSVYAFREELRKTLLIKKLFDKVIVVPQISDTEIDNFILSHQDVIAAQTAGKNLTPKEISDAVRLTLVEIKKNEMINKYTQNLMDSNSADITYYNQFAVLME